MARRTTSPLPMFFRHADLVNLNDEENNDNLIEVYGPISPITGKFSEAVNLDTYSGYGTCKHVIKNNQTTIDFTSNWSLSCWFKLNSSTNNQCIYWYDKNDINFFVGIHGGKIYMGENGFIGESGEISISSGAIYNLIITHDSSGNFLSYVSGVADDSFNAIFDTWTTVNERITIGADSPDTGNWGFNGWIDDLAIMTGVLTSDERNAIYNSGTGNLINIAVMTTPIHNYWKFNKA